MCGAFVGGGHTGVHGTVSWIGCNVIYQFLQTRKGFLIFGTDPPDI